MPKPGAIGTVLAWSVRVIGYAPDGRLVFERIGVYADGKRYAADPGEFSAINYLEDLEDSSTAADAT